MCPAAQACGAAGRCRCVPYGPGLHDADGSGSSRTAEDFTSSGVGVPGGAHAVPAAGNTRSAHGGVPDRFPRKGGEPVPIHGVRFLAARDASAADRTDTADGGTCGGRRTDGRCAAFRTVASGLGKRSAPRRIVADCFHHGHCAVATAWYSRTLPVLRCRANRTRPPPCHTEHPPHGRFGRRAGRGSPPGAGAPVRGCPGGDRRNAHRSADRLLGRVFPAVRRTVLTRRPGSWRPHHPWRAPAAVGGPCASQGDGPCPSSSQRSCSWACSARPI